MKRHNRLSYRKTPAVAPKLRYCRTCDANRPASDFSTAHSHQCDECKKLRAERKSDQQAAKPPAGQRRPLVYGKKHDAMVEAAR